MVNKATASITRSQEEPNLKRPMIPLRFISKPAELGTTHGLAHRRLRVEGLPQGWGWTTLAHPAAVGLCPLIYRTAIMSTLCRPRAKTEELRKMSCVQLVFSKWETLLVFLRGEKRDGIKPLDGELPVHNGFLDIGFWPLSSSSVSASSSCFMSNSRILEPPHALFESKTDSWESLWWEHFCHTRTQGWGLSHLVLVQSSDTVGMAQKAKYLNCYKNQRQKK